MTLVALFFLFPSATRAATLFLSPSTVSVDMGTSVTETVFVASADQALNAISGVISFPADLLQVISVSKASSILSLWVADPTFSNVDGTISWSGIVPNPGYLGGRGQVFSIQFRGKKSGTATISFSSSSQVLANDGNGTDILTDTQSGTVIISTTQSQPAPTSAPVPSSVTTVPSSQSSDLLAHITSSSHPNETLWYKIPHAVFDWTNAQGVSSVRLGYDKNADGKPSVVYNESISHKELDLSDGIWYFHVQEKGGSGWGPVSTYRVQVDTVPPLPFAVSFPNGTTTPAGSSLVAQFMAVDELSGIDQYRVAVDGKEFTVTADEGNHPYQVTGDSGAHMLLVQAYDKAGNMLSANGRFFVSEGATSTPFNLFAFGWLTVNYISFVLIALTILGTLLFAAWYIRVHFSAYRRKLNNRLGITHTHVHKEFDSLKESISEEILTLEQTKSRRALTLEEQRLVTRFKDLLNKSEQAIEKDIEDIPR